MRILRFAQHGTDGNVSEDFFNEHLGRCTASSASAIMDFTQKGGSGSTRELYLMEKVAEILSSRAAQDHFVSAPMKAGTFSEPAARTAYELEEGVMVEEVGMVVGDNERCGWSPDGLVIDAEGNLIGGKIVGAIEAKCPRTTTHLRWIRNCAVAKSPVIPIQHLPQLYFAFMCCPPLQWIDFISRDGGMSNDPAMFGPILPRRYLQFTIRLHRAGCEAQIAKMREATDKFLAEVDETIELINSVCPEVAEPERVAEDFGDMGISDADIGWAKGGFKDDHADCATS